MPKSKWALNRDILVILATKFKLLRRMIKQRLDILENSQNLILTIRRMTVLIRILLYRAKFEWRNFLHTRKIRLIDDIISLWTWPWNIGTGPYGHAEVWTPDGNGKFYRQAIDHLETSGEKYYLSGPHGTCYTSTLRDKNNGTVKRPASEVLKNPERWDYIELDLPEDMYKAMLYWMENEVKNNLGYDKKAILSFLTPWRFHNKYKNICSEFVYNALVIAGVFPLPYKVISPRRLAKLLKRLYIKGVIKNHVRRLVNG